MSESIVETLTEDHEYPKFNPSFVPVKVDENTIHIRSGPWSGPIFTIRDVDRDGSVTEMVDLLDGHHHVEDVLGAFEPDQREEIAQILRGLYDNNIVHDRGEHDGDSAWPHMSLQYRFQNQNRERLESKELLVVDCCGMGLQVAEDLLEMGLGGVRFLEPFDSADIDTSSLRSEERFTEVETELESAIESVDFAVYTADEPHPSLLDAINSAAFESDTPWIPAQIHGFDGIVGPAVYPGETACYECFQHRMQANVRGSKGYQAYRQQMDEDDSLATLTLPSASRLVSGYLALDVTHLLAYGTGYTSGRVLTVDTLDLSMEANDVLRMPRCDVCGKSRGSDYQRYVTMDDIVEASDRMEASPESE